jgi:tetratricopeptide (TPR) repeat protein
MDWFQAEHRVLLAITALAASTGFDSHAWQLPMTFFRYLDWQGLWDDWKAVQRTARAAAQRLADQAAQACVLRSDGMLSMRLGSYPEACAQFEHALHLYAGLGDPIGQARAHGDLSMLFAIQDRYREALGHSERALELSAATGHAYLHATMLNKVGWHAAHLGDYQRALACCQQALTLQQGLDNRYSEAFVWDSLGYIHQHLHHHAQSLECFHRAATLFGEIGNRFELAATHTNLGDAYLAAGDHAAASGAWQQAISILDDLHHSSAASIRAKLHDHAARGSACTASAPETTAGAGVNRSSAYQAPSAHGTAAPGRNSP